MRTKDIELGKGGRVRFFFFFQKKDGRERIVLFDNQGVAYTSQWVYYITEEFFDKVNVRTTMVQGLLYVNGKGVTADKESSELNYCK